MISAITHRPIIYDYFNHIFFLLLKSRLKLPRLSSELPTRFFFRGLLRLFFITSLLVLSPLLMGQEFTDASKVSRLSDDSNSLSWVLKKSKRDVQIYTAKVAGSKYVAVLSVMTVKAPANSLAALVMDLKYCPKWAAMCKEAKLHKKISATESIVYSLNDAPFPVRDRDVVAKVEWRVDETTQKISMFSHAIVSPDNVRKGVVRVNKAVSEWHFTPQKNGKTLVENYAHIDPNGALPAWIINLLIIDSPYKSFKNMRRIVESGKYNNAVLPFISTTKEHVDN